MGYARRHHSIGGTDLPDTAPRLTIVLPYYNEEAFIGATLQSLIAQTSRDFRLVVVNNRSSDGSPALVESLLADSGLAYAHVLEETPGFLPALVRGIAEADSELLAVANADVIYPPHYVATILRLFDANPRATSVMAIDLYDPEGTELADKRKQQVLGAARFLPKKCHAGSYAQAYRMDAYRSCGGFDPAIWPYVLEDHEIMARLMRTGPSVYDRQHYCHPSPRRTNTAQVSWNQLEKILYGLVPFPLLGWFFHGFLAPRFARRKLMNAALRQRSWDVDQTDAGATG